MAKKMWQYLMIATLIFGAMGPLTSVVAADQVDVADTDTSATQEKRTNNDTQPETETLVSNEEETQENDNSGNFEPPQVDAGKVEQTDSPESPTVDQESTTIDETDTSEVPETDEEVVSTEDPEVDSGTQEDSSIIEEDEKNQTSDTDKIADAVNPTEEESLKDESDESNLPSDVKKEDETEADKMQEDSSTKTSDKKTKVEEFKLHAPSVVLFSDSTAPYQASVSGAPEPDLTWRLEAYLHEVSPSTNSSPLDFYATTGALDGKNLLNKDRDIPGILEQKLRVISDGKQLEQDVILGGLSHLNISEFDFINHGLYFTISAAQFLPTAETWNYHWEATTFNGGGQQPQTVTLSNFNTELTNISGTIDGRPSDSDLALRTLSDRATNNFLQRIKESESSNGSLYLRLVLTNEKQQTYFSNYAAINVTDSQSQKRLSLISVPWMDSPLISTSASLQSGTPIEKTMRGSLFVRDTRPSEVGNNWLLSVQATSFSNNETTIPFDYQMTTTAGNLNIVGDDVNKQTIFHGTRAEEFETNVSMTFIPRSREITSITKGTYEAVFTWSLAATTETPDSL